MNELMEYNPESITSYFSDFPASREGQIAFLQSNGIPVDKTTIWALDQEDKGTNGGHLIVKAACLYIRTRIESGYLPTHKDQYMLAVLDALIQVRDEQFEHYQDAEKLTNNIIKDTSLLYRFMSVEGNRAIQYPDQTLRRVLTAMRTEIFLESLWERDVEGNPALYNTIFQTALNFVSQRRNLEEAKAQSHRRATGMIEDLEQSLSNDDLQGFYNRIQGSNRFFNEYILFELDLLRQFYQKRLSATASTRLTHYVLDRTIERFAMTQRGITRFEQALRRVIGIRLNDVTHTYRNILIYGYPT